MWAITSYYNPAKYKNRLPNFRMFRTNLSIPLVTVELSFDGNFELAKNDSDVLVQIVGGASVWQKERLLNVGLKSVPPGVNDIAWIDSDVLFEGTDWIERTKRQLQTFYIVQLFSDVVDLKQNECQITAEIRDAAPSGRSMASLVSERPGDAVVILEQVVQARAKCTGVAWAAKRDILERHGLYDASIVGGGDRALVAAVYGHFETLMDAHHLNARRREHYLKWARPFNLAIGGRVGHVDGRIYHVWHGDARNRKHSERHRWFSDFEFDPDTDLRVGLNGAWQWARPRPDLEIFFKKYFSGRAEDG